jgi:phosphomannomutase/phosphoglucomutase
MKFALGLGKKTALQAAMEQQKAPLDAQRLGITAGVGLGLVLAVVSLFDGVQRGREESSATALNEARASLTKSVGSEVRKQSLRVAAAAADTELLLAITGFDAAAQMRAKQRLRVLMPELVDAEFHDASLPDLIEADLAKFGYAKADILAEARESGQGARVQVHACGEAQCLALGQTIRNGDAVVGYLYALLPIDPIVQQFEAAAPGGGRLELRQGKSAQSASAVIGIDRSPGTTASADVVDPVPGSLLSVATRVPTLFRIGAVLGVFEERGSTSLLLQGLFALAGVGGLIYLRQRLPKHSAMARKQPSGRGGTAHDHGAGAAETLAEAIRQLPKRHARGCAAGLGSTDRESRAGGQAQAKSPAQGYRHPQHVPGLRHPRRTSIETLTNGTAQADRPGCRQRSCA